MAAKPTTFARWGSGPGGAHQASQLRAPGLHSPCSCGMLSHLACPAAQKRLSPHLHLCPSPQNGTFPGTSCITGYTCTPVAGYAGLSLNASQAMATYWECQQGTRGRRFKL